MGSYTLKGTNETIKAGDQVLIKPFSTKRKELPYVGFVKRIILGTNTSEPQVTVTWFYRPKDTRYANREFISKKELFYSSETETHSVETIISKCFVHNFHDFCKLEVVGPLDFFCRYKYDPATDKIKAEKDTVVVYCKCRMPNNPDRFMTECEGSCKNWYHPSCLNMTDEEAEQMNPFLCTDCRPITHSPVS